MRAFLGLESDPLYDIQAILELDVTVHRKINYLIALKHFLKIAIKEDQADVYQSYASLIEQIINRLAKESLLKDIDQR